MVTIRLLLLIFACFSSVLVTDALHLQSKQLFLEGASKSIHEKANKMIQHAIGISFISGALLLGAPQSAISVTDEVVGSLETAIIDSSGATYPILKSLKSDSVTPLTNKVATIITKKIPTEKLTKALDGTADTLLSIPDDKLENFIETVKASYQGVSIDSCDTIPFPTSAATKISTSDGISNMNSEKLAQVNDKVISPLSKSVPFSTDRGICIPSNKEGLQQIWIGQTKLFLSIPTPIKQKLATDVGLALKSVPSTELLRILPDAKNILAGVDRKEANQFQETSKVLDKALKQDPRLKSVQLF